VKQGLISSQLPTAIAPFSVLSFVIRTSPEL
jgi:hypothetical protein